MPKAKATSRRVTKKTSVSLSKEILPRAFARARALGFKNSFSAYIEKLIADDLKAEPISSSPVSVDESALSLTKKAVRRISGSDLPFDGTT